MNFLYILYLSILVSGQALYLFTIWILQGLPSASAKGRSYFYPEERLAIGQTKPSLLLHVRCNFH